MTETKMWAPPTSAELFEEQSRTQRTKMWSRGISSYSSYLFPHTFDSATNLFADLAPDATNMLGLLEISNRQANGEMHWADMPGGLGIAMKQAAKLQAGGELSKFAMTNVDLIDWAAKLATSEKERIYRRSDIDPGRDQNQPNLVQGNAERVQLPEPADLITSIEGIQYFYDPLRFLMNCYNQLREGGLMVVACSTYWSDSITQDGIPGKPFRSLIGRLDDHNVQYATDLLDRPVNYYWDEPRFKKLAIRRKPKTQFSLKAQIEGVEIDEPSKYKSVQYGSQTPALEVMTV